jgi:RNA polymerase sigma factor (sigma-70 family)
VPDVLAPATPPLRFGVRRFALACAVRARLIGSCAPGGANKQVDRRKGSEHMERQSRNGHRGSEDALFRQHHHRLVVGIERSLGISAEMAEDAVAYAWMQLVRKHPEHDNPVGWLYTVAKHEAFALIRTAARYQPAEQVEPDERAPAPPRIVEARRKLALLDRLKPQQCLVLRLRMAGLSYREICQCTGRTHTWVNRHVTEGRQALRRLVEEEDS